MTSSKTFIALASTLLMSASLVAEANDHGRGHGRDYHGHNNDFAKVVSATPVYETFQRRIPEEQCWVENVRVEERGRATSPTGTIVGGVIGGALGNAVGHHRSNKKVGTVVGAVLGAAIGNDISRRHSGGGSVYYEDQERCETTYRTVTEERLNGYDVAYRYGGKIYHTHTNEHPGNRIRVGVNVYPTDY